MKEGFVSHACSTIHMKLLKKRIKNTYLEILIELLNVFNFPLHQEYSIVYQLDIGFQSHTIGRNKQH